MGHLGGAGCIVAGVLLVLKDQQIRDIPAGSAKYGLKATPISLNKFSNFKALCALVTAFCFSL